MCDSSCSINLNAQVITSLKELKIPEAYLSKLENASTEHHLREQTENSTSAEHHRREQTENSTSVDQDFAELQTRFGRVVKQPDRLTY